MLSDSTVVVVAVVRLRPRAIPLPMITMRIFTGFFFSIWLWGSAYWPFGRRSSAINMPPLIPDKDKIFGVFFLDFRK